MLTVSDLLVMNNEELYSLYLEALKDRDLNLVNVVRSVVADRFTIKALKQPYSPVDNWKSNPEITRFFTVK